MEGKVAVLGSSDFVMPFSVLGLDIFIAGDSPDEITDAAKKIIQGDYALIVVAEDKAEMAEEALSDLQNMPTPCIIVVPFTTESKGLATKSLGEMLKMATGINILQSN